MQLQASMMNTQEDSYQHSKKYQIPSFHIVHTHGIPLFPQNDLKYVLNKECFFFMWNPDVLH